MNRPSRPRKIANLSDQSTQQLNVYAFAAPATGVGELALAKPAQSRKSFFYEPSEGAHPTMSSGKNKERWHATASWSLGHGSLRA